MNLLTVTKEELLELIDDLPYASSLNNEKILCYSVIIVPSNEIHDSGFQTMWFICLDRQANPIAKAGGGSDVLHLDGIGAYGEYGVKNYKCGCWSMDCLPCGYIRILNHQGIRVGDGFSDYGIYTKQ